MTTRILPMRVIHVDDTINVSRGGVAIRESPNLLGLAEDIKAHGLIENVGVVHVQGALWLNGEERQELLAVGKEFVLVYGFRRFKACSIIGFDDIRCEDIGSASRAQAELENLAENCGREPPTEFDLTFACHRCSTMHALASAVVAKRVNKPIKFVEDSVLIVDRVDPDLLQFYRANCSVVVRRKMISLSAIDGETKEVRYERQQEQWKQWEQEEASARPHDPDADFAPRAPRGSRKNDSGSLTHGQLVNAAESIIVATSYYDGYQWRPMTPDVLAALRSFARWTLNPRETLPVR